MFDVIIHGGLTADGISSDPERADVGVTADRITAVGDLSSAEAGLRIDAADCIVAPGFVDVHNHSDGWMLKEPLQTAKILQGFTSEVLMLDGIGYAPVDERTWREWFFYLRSLDGLRLDEYRGWKSAEDFMQLLDRTTTQNSLMHVPYANVRSLFCGFGPRPVDDFQMRSIQAEVRRSMEAGAVGLSTGLDYIVQCHSTTEELTEVCRIVAEYGGLYATHVRYKKGLIPALNEALQIARDSGTALHISHLKAITGETADNVLNWVERARREVSLSFDVYPYMPGSTMLNYLLPYEVWDRGPIAAVGRLTDTDIRERFRWGLRQFKLPLDRIRIAWLPSRENAVHQGKLLSEYVEWSGLPAEEALLNLLIEERLSVLCVYIEGDDRLIHPFLQHDLYMMGSDGIHAQDGIVHPRQYGSAARLLGACVREHGLFSVSDAVRKLSTNAANRFGLRDRGVIRENAMADLVVFDPQTISDRATYDDPRQTAIGMRHVIVNGEPVVEDGRVTAIADGRKLPGRFLKYRQ
ncbi:MAG: amidohydrolase family protein [Planctomycetaceae bacterium]|nr:amidohydrolase family protein [Planctomycetaceae bacterium]